MFIHYDPIMMLRRALLRNAAAGLAVLVAGCSGGDGGTEPSAERSTETPSPDAVVEMVGTSFEPRRLEVSTGDTVMWDNGSNYGHTVTSVQFHDSAQSWSFDEGAPGGETVTHTFDDSGVYEYYCTQHGRETMCGVVLAGDATLDKSLPCEDGG